MAYAGILRALGVWDNHATRRRPPESAERHFRAGAGAGP